jgi:serine/threonine protein kinase
MDNAYFFYDMQFCDLNLHRYIAGAFPDPLPPQLDHLKNPQTPRAKVQRAMCILLDIAEGLAYIHTRREVHRDMKPENGIPKIIIRLTV